MQRICRYHQITVASKRSHRHCGERSGPVVQRGLQMYRLLKFGEGSFKLCSILLTEAVFWMAVVRFKSIVANNCRLLTCRGPPDRSCNSLLIS
jgi:hypothetical protein